MTGLCVRGACGIRNYIEADTVAAICFYTQFRLLTSNCHGLYIFETNGFSQESPAERICPGITFYIVQKRCSVRITDWIHGILRTFVYFLGPSRPMSRQLDGDRAAFT
jgi:hypothetical protein